MKKNLTPTVMKKIINYEKKRISNFKMFFYSIIAVLSMLTVVIFASLIYILNSQHAFDPFQLFGEDGEIISLFWKDVVSDFIIELPYDKIFLVILAFLAIVFILVYTHKKRRIIHMQEAQIESTNTPKSEVQAVSTEIPQPTGKKSSKSGLIIALGLIFTIVIIGSVFAFMKINGQNSSRDKDAGNPFMNKASSAITTSPAPTTPIPTTTPVLPSEISLTIDSPLNNTVTTTPQVTVRGKTSPNADIIVGEVEAVADKNGAFSANVSLEEDENLIVVTAIDENGKSAEKELTITYTPSE